PLKYSTLAVIVLLISAAIFVPWKIIAEQKIIALLAQNGFAGSSVTLSHIGLKSAQMENLRLSKDATPLFDKLKVNFSARDLIKGHVDHLDFSGLNLQLEQNTTGWMINGAPMAAAKPDDAPAKLTLPTSRDELSHILVDSAELKDSTIHLTLPSAKLEAPIIITFHKFPDAVINTTFKNVRIAMNGITMNVTDLHLSAKLDEAEKKWRGTWQASGIETKGRDNLVPTLTGSGTIEASATIIALDGTFNSADKAHEHNVRAAFTYNYPLNTPEKAQLRLTSAALPWNKGVLSLKNTLIPLNGKDDIHLILNVDHVPVSVLMKMLTGKDTAATGDVAGAIPIIIKPNGLIVIDQGKLGAEKPGVITLPPESIPGDNEQIALVRDIMKNLHYTVLSIGMDSDKNHKLSAVLAVEGNNPDVANGRPVKLNVHLNGDLLDFIQQSLMSLIDPHMFIKQDLHAK
ncbi:MAG: hypothetical protein EB059_10790, partial [Alphaproteobacteria bacterium]|nr:hypothetical protein [Alphaproteobacteria bacterium]